MRLYFLGTGAGVPSKRRNVSSLCLRLEAEIGQVWMFDCGEGTQHRVLASPIRLSKLTRIFVTHLHGDHIYGLPGLLASRSFQSPERPLHVYGPSGLGDYLQATLTASGVHLTYPLNLHELHDGQRLAADGFSVHVRALNHGVTCYGYRIVEPPKPGRLRRESLEALGVRPGPLYQLVKQGKTVRLADGRVLHGPDFVDPPVRGRTVAIMGDTLPCPQTVELAADADVLVHEATYTQADAALALTHHHSTGVQAAEQAGRARVKQLILTHLSSRYEPDRERELLAEARSVFSRTELAHDFSEFIVPSAAPYHDEPVNE
ncbi:ribonuclease Z [Alicyclobacillus shizuokensis]|uniref:ribonuclease Z n=1 Tax=Alicyclobacillus shizuokensis TaxID=392014 RepID=UPI00082A6A4C|nr:ribonuclease Z [Alicyclobacillus shizuokensis]MCL6625123.1 ribonuclease Z [Alicyclobacillus shizuokensis]